MVYWNFNMNEELIKLFKESNLTQEDFAKIIGVSRTRLCNIIYNKQILGLNTFYKYKVKVNKNNNRKPIIRIIKVKENDVNTYIKKYY